MNCTPNSPSAPCVMSKSSALHIMLISRFSCMCPRVFRKLPASHMIAPFHLNKPHQRQRLDKWKKKLQVPPDANLDSMLVQQYDVSTKLRPHACRDGCGNVPCSDCQYAATWKGLLLSPRGVDDANEHEQAVVHVCRRCNAHLRNKNNTHPPKLAINNGNW
jgi:hypothetical protein